MPEETREALYTDDELALAAKLAKIASGSKPGSTARREAVNCIDVLHEMKVLLDASLTEIEEDDGYTPDASSPFQIPAKAHAMMALAKR